MSQRLSRRGFLKSTGAAGGLAVAASTSLKKTATAQESNQSPTFRYCFNTSTIRGQEISLDKEVDLIAKAGYDGLEPWIREIQQFKEAGGKLSDLKKRIDDHGLTVESAIGFARWIVDDDATRAAALEQAKREMDLLRQIGGIRIAAPPAGATNEAGLDLFKAAERYHALCEVGREMGVLAQVELWGFSKNLSRLGEVAFVAIESGHPDACILTDVYHIYKGGSDFSGLNHIAGSSMHAIHMNDYPADPPRETIGDGDRVYPGDGVAPLNDILQGLVANGFGGILSLELFSKIYWEQDALHVAKTGIAKMKQAVGQAFG